MSNNLLAITLYLNLVNDVQCGKGSPDFCGEIYRRATEVAAASLVMKRNENIRTMTNVEHEVELSARLFETLEGVLDGAT
ncbi:hypothetical protein BLOT_001202 [Blomia tropicalis]|nr:hypothetical protein BLOT_001202 [Blomia tropicalis]